MNNLSQTIQLQQIASNPRNSAWVFASAGSGKTKILTDRVLRLLLDDVSPNKILCLTFTKVAASEMQNRINAELADWVLCDDEKLRDKLHKISGNSPTENELKKARILFVKILDEDSKIKVQTIHSFCQTLIKIFPFESKVKPNFEVIEQAKEKLLLKEAQKEILKNATKKNPDQFLKNLIVQINSTLHEATFSYLVANLLNKKEKLNLLKENFFGIEGVINEIFKNFSLSQNENEREIFEKFFTKINQKEVLYLALALENSGLINNSKIASAIKIFLQKPNLENFPTYQQAFFTKENEPRKTSKKIYEDAELSAIIKDQQDLIFQFNDYFNSLKICENSARLLRFIDKILENYSNLKKQNAFLDYNDLIIKTNELLANPDFSNWVKLKMDSSFDHILIDESQDTNHQQWNIIKALSEDFFSGLSANNKKRSIFVVGDEKQSIYSFQGAEPNISEEIFSYFQTKLSGIETLHKIELNNSFRSLSEILRAVDDVFADEIRAKSISKVNKLKAHQAIRIGSGKVEIWPQIKNEKAEKTENSYDWEINFEKNEILEDREILAQFIALKIKNWVENKRIVETHTKPVKYSDFMILLRNHTNGFDEALMKFFHQYEIPFSSLSKIKFSKNLLIQDLLAAAKFTLLQDDDLNLACLLKSPICGISEEDLFEICLVKNQQKTSIYEALAQIEKFSETKKSLDLLIKKSQELNCFEFFYFLLNHQNIRQKIISYFGDENVELLDKFNLIVFDFCQKFSPNLQKFLEFIEKLDPEISLSGSEDDRVKISTIHSAKGLQASIVMLPDCCYNFNQLLATKEEISWIDLSESSFPIWCAKKSDENQLVKKHRQSRILQAKEEYLRLLYVAMTRAEDELYIGGFGNSSDPESWYEIVKNSLPHVKKLSEEEFFEWLEAEKEKVVKSSKLTRPRNECGVTNLNHSHQRHHLALVAGSSDQKTFTNQTDSAAIKGKLIHKILEIFGKNYREEKNWLLNLAKNLIEKTEFLNKKEKLDILDEVTGFLNSALFTEIFSGDIKCESEIISEVNNKIISARIDLLIEKENEILIIDYKSDETLPDKVPQQYYDQLKTYEKLVKNLYPNKKISCAILWVKFLKLEA